MQQHSKQPARYAAQTTRGHSITKNGPISMSTSICACVHPILNPYLFLTPSFPFTFTTSVCLFIHPFFDLHARSFRRDGGQSEIRAMMVSRVMECARVVLRWPGPTVAMLTKNRLLHSVRFKRVSGTVRAQNMGSKFTRNSSSRLRS